jgi:hypothetical protein
MRANRNGHKILVGKSKRTRLLGRYTRVVLDSVNTDFKEVQYGVWTGFIWLRIESSGGLYLTTVMDFRVPQKVKCDRPCQSASQSVFITRVLNVSGSDSHYVARGTHAVHPSLFLQSLQSALQYSSLKFCCTSGISHYQVEFLTRSC